jgi:lactate dehydrogenase-like 2-hydroxyacid dehydrogenase
MEAALAARYQVHKLAHEADPDGFLAAHGRSFDGLVTSAFVGLPPKVMAALPNLKVISNFGVGVDRIDLDEARRRGVVVGYTPDVLNDCVADLAFGLLLDVARGLSASDRFVRRGDWTLQRKFPLTTRVSGKRLGIVGLGRIGQIIARRASGFDMAIRYTNRRPLEGVAHAFEPSLTALAAWCDFLVVCTPGGAATQDLVNAEVLQALGPQGFLINVARGSVVNEPALVAALQTGVIAGAGLDVFAQEPHIPDALKLLDNVVLLPHVASGTHETREAMAELTLANLDAFFAGREVVSP